MKISIVGIPIDVTFAWGLKTPFALSCASILQFGLM
jgi:hypothetical protein